MPTPSVPTASAHLTCLCTSITLPGTHLKDRAFPIPSSVCHCNPCRYTSGGLIPTFADLTGPPPEDIKAKLTAYQFTETCVRYFCTKCGCHCFVEHPLKEEEEEWLCTGGIIEGGDDAEVKDVIELAGHTYVSDTVDGGVVPLLLPITFTGEEEIYSAKHGNEKVSSRDLNERVQTARQHPAPQPGAELQARCHCGGIDLRIKRADYDAEPSAVKTLMSPDDPHKYLARFCACRSCRLSMGFSLCPWTYVALSSVTNGKTGKPVTFGSDAEKEGANEGLELRHHWSSEGVWRSFCGGCGTSVFYYTSREERNDIVDVAVGLLRAGSGSLAREWMRWADGEVSHGDEGTDSRQVECVEQHGRIL